MKINPELAAKFASSLILILTGLGISLNKYGITEQTLTEIVQWVFMSVGVLGAIRTWFKRKRHANENG